MQVDIGIAHFVALGAVANHEQKNVLGGSVDEPVGVVASGREAGAQASAQTPPVQRWFQLDLAFQA
jgi:hypothetical protein